MPCKFKVGDLVVRKKDSQHIQYWLKDCLVRGIDPYTTLTVIDVYSDDSTVRLRGIGGRYKENKFELAKPTRKKVYK